MGFHDQVRIDLKARLRQRLQIAPVPLHRLGRIEIAQEDDPFAAQAGQMQGRAPASRQIVRADRAIQLVRHLGAPDHEPPIGLGQPVQTLVQKALAEKDHAVGPRIHGRRQVIVAGRGEVAEDHVAVALARRLADARQQFKKEGVAQPSLAPLRPRCHKGDDPVGADRPGRHVAAERIVVLPRQLPDQLLGPGVDRRTVVERARGRRNRHARQLGQILQAGVASAHVWFPADGGPAKFAANLACSAPRERRLASPFAWSSSRC